MTQYLLSVWHEGDVELPDPETMQQIFAQVDAFNAEMQASGAWVFAGGLHPPSSATVVRAEGGDVSMTDGPYAESKEQMGGFWVIEAARPRRRPRVGREGRGGLQRAGRGAPVPGRLS